MSSTNLSANSPSLSPRTTNTLINDGSNSLPRHFNEHDEATEKSILLKNKRNRTEEDSMITRTNSLHDRDPEKTLFETKKLGSGEGYPPPNDGKYETNFFDKFCSKAFGLVWSGSPYSGLACMACSSICYSFMSFIIKFLTARQIPCFQMLMLRSLLISSLSGLLLKKMKLPLLGEESQRRMILWRSAIGFVSLAAFFYSIEILPLRDAIILNFTAPVFTAIFARIILNENFSYKDFGGTIFSFLGVIMVTQPSLFVSSHSQYALRSAIHKPEARNSIPAGGLNLFGVSIALLAALAGGIAFCIVRLVGKAGEHPLIIVFCFAAFSFPASFVCLIIFQKPILPTFFEVFGMICVGLFACIAQIFFTRSLQLEKAGRAMTMQYVKVVCTYFLGVFFLHEIPTLVGFLGALLIASSSFFFVLRRLD